MRQYWNVERQMVKTRLGVGPMVDSILVCGSAGETVELTTTRWQPLDELEAIAKALNAMPEYGGM